MEDHRNQCDLPSPLCDLHTQHDTHNRWFCFYILIKETYMVGQSIYYAFMPNENEMRINCK